MMPQHQVNWETNKEKKIFEWIIVSIFRENPKTTWWVPQRETSTNGFDYFFSICVVLSLIYYLIIFFSFPLNIFLLLIFLFPHLNIGIVTYFTGIWLRPQLAFGQPFGTRSLGSATTGGCRYATMLTGSGSDVTRDPLPFWRNWYRLLWWRRR